MIAKRFFDTYNGQDIFAYTLCDTISATIVTLGATVIKLEVPDKNGKLVDVALGVTTAFDVANKGSYMGSVVGRCGNRIDGGFTLDEKYYPLDLNDDGKAHLHGGFDGFNKRIFTPRVEGNSLVLSLASPDGDQGYCGRVELTVKYTVVDTTLCIEYFGKTDKTTLLNPTNHLYFNLNGESDGSVLDNQLCIKADGYLAVDDCLIPTQKIKVAGTPFDFNVAKPIGQDIGAEDAQLQIAGGYDHNFCLTDSHFCTALSAKTGIIMRCYTDLPGVQFYSGNFLDGVCGKSVYNKNAGFCLETQYYPNAINRDDCKKPILQKGENFYSKTCYLFDVDK